MSKHIHIDHTEHSVDMDNGKVLDVGPHWFKRMVKEVIHTWVAKPTLKKDGGMFDLPGSVEQCAEVSTAAT